MKRILLHSLDHERTDETCIIVVQAQGVEMGIVVDRVPEVTCRLWRKMNNRSSASARGV